MKQIVIISVLLSLCSCEQTVNIGKERKVHQDFDPAVTAEPNNETTYDSLMANVIKGDFDGDGYQDNLTETLISSIDNKSINRLPQIDYDSLVVLIHKKKPILSLKSENYSIPELILSKSAAFGLLYIKNEGDLNNDGTDEISVVIDWADWSQVNSCIVFSLKNNEWIEYAKFEIREWQISRNPDFNGFVIKNIKGNYEVSTFDSEMTEILQPLRKVLVTSTKSHGLNNHIREARVS